jgi:hypothetical protein
MLIYDNRTCFRSLLRKANPLIAILDSRIGCCFEFMRVHI